MRDIRGRGGGGLPLRSVFFSFLAFPARAPQRVRWTVAAARHKGARRLGPVEESLAKNPKHSHQNPLQTPLQKPLTDVVEGLGCWRVVPIL